MLVAAAERGEAGCALVDRAKGEDQETTPLDPQQLEKELLLAREAVNCKCFVCYVNFHALSRFELQMCDKGTLLRRNVLRLNVYEMNFSAAEYRCCNLFISSQQEKGWRICYSNRSSNTMF